MSIVQLTLIGYSGLYETRNARSQMLRKPMKPKMRMPVERFEIEHPDGTIAGWHSPATGETAANILFCHATGFNASAYQYALSMVDPSVAIWAIDMRGHGLTQLPTQLPLRSWSIYTDDVAFVLRRLRNENSGAAKWIIVGHSMGAVTAAMVAARDGAIDQVCLIEPVALPRGISLLAATPFWPPFRKRFSMVVNAARRRDRFESFDHVRESYLNKPFFAAWHPESLGGYLRDGLRPVEKSDPQGAVELTCSPIWEAATFGAQANPFWSAIGQLKARAQIYCGDDRSSTVRPFAIRQLKRYGAGVEILSDRGHLFPMTHPGETAQILSQIARSRSFSRSML